MEVYKTWTLILQLGISMLVPIFMLIALAYVVEKYLNLNVMLIFVLIGTMVGIRNVYVILRNYVNSMSKPNESELMKKHKDNIKK